MAPFFTRKGDEGYTNLLGEGRYLKSDLRFELLGTIDEASAAFGLARSLSQSEINKSIVLTIQKKLSNLMTELAATSKNVEHYHSLNKEDVDWIEMKIEDLEKKVAYPGEFILPGDSSSGAALDLARTIIRRGERLFVDFSHQENHNNSIILQFINRLSSLCFVLELIENQESN